jgi:methylmalonic aciduria homocystinuria type C protein
LDSTALTDALTRALAPAGLDLVQPFRTGTYDDAVDAIYRLPDLGRGPEGLGILIGSSSAIWTPFLAALAAEPWRIDRGHPMDRWVEERVRAAAAALPVPTEVRFAPEPPPRRVAMQRLAHVSGLAPLGPAHLNLHPRFGPWIALRAVVIADAPAPDDHAPPPLPPPCTTCDCGARLSALSQRASTWKDWLALRDACVTGREHRYPDEQIRYHYTKDPTILRGLLAARS